MARTGFMPNEAHEDMSSANLPTVNIFVLLTTWATLFVTKTNFVCLHAPPMQEVAPCVFKVVLCVFHPFYLETPRKEKGVCGTFWLLFFWQVSVLRRGICVEFLTWIYVEKNSRAALATLRKRSILSNSSVMFWNCGKRTLSENRITNQSSPYM